MVVPYECLKAFPSFATVLVKQWFIVARAPHSKPQCNNREGQPLVLFFLLQHTMSMRAFEDIPNEILLQIVRDVQFSDQLSLSLISRRLHSIAEPHLYRSVTLADSDEETKSERKLQKFLRTIISRPELGAITRHLDILWYGVGDDTSRRRKNSFDVDKSYLATMQALAREKGLSALAVSELENGWCRPHFSLLMHLLPSLEFLLLREMGPDTMMRTRWIWAQSEYHGPTPVGLRSLSNLEMSYYMDEDGLRAEDVIPFMSLPTLNSFRASFFGGWGKIRWDKDNKEHPRGGKKEKQKVFRSMQFVKRSSKLKKLELYCSAVEPELFDGILQIPEALDTLVYENAGDVVLFHDMDPPAFARALRHQMHSLTTLSVTIAADLSEMISNIEPVGSMGSLGDFTSLKTLRMPCLYLLGDPSASDHSPHDSTKFFDLLPSSLVHLSIGIGEEWDIRKFLNAVGGEDVSRWKCVRDQKVPYLETFTLRSYEPEDASDELEALEIRFCKVSQDRF